MKKGRNFLLRPFFLNAMIGKIGLDSDTYSDKSLPAFFNPSRSSTLKSP